MNEDLKETDNSVENCTSYKLEKYDDETDWNDMDQDVKLNDFDFISLPEDIVKEEEKLANENLHSSAISSASLQIDDDEKEKRYKNLMNLLGKSKEYASYMSKKLIQCKEEIGQKKVLWNSIGDLNGRKTKNSVEEATKNKKIKIEESADMRTAYNSETEYINRMNFVVSKRQPKPLVGGVMRDYQLDGLDWMIALYTNGVNGILADEMGLGKTIQVISLISHLREKKIYGPHLIVAPLSTLPNWMMEFANFTPDIPVVLFHGNASQRLNIRNDFMKIMTSKEREKIPIVLTSYEMPLFDKIFLSMVKWCYMIVDEGHRLKNHKSALSRQLRQYTSESRLLLTGTPLQNNLTELWALLNFLIPEIFNNLEDFENIFDFSDLTNEERHNYVIRKEKDEQIVSKMHQILEPFLLRRMKNDVSIAIPRKKEILVYAPLTPEQESVYKGVLDRSIIDAATPGNEEEKKNLLNDGAKAVRKCKLNPISYDEDWNIDPEQDYSIIPRIIFTAKSVGRGRIREGDIEWVYNLKFTNPSMMLRKIANHPYLVKTPVELNTRNIRVDETLIKNCGKMLVLDALLPKLKADGHKVLLFSSFVTLLNLVEDYVVLRNYKFCRLDGTSCLEDRLQAIKTFNTDKDVFIFLITSRAGGLGINLTAADTVIIYDSDWNPQVDLQAQDRCHRIGQTRPVVVYRLVTLGTIDERIVNVATNKRRLEKVVMKHGKFKQKYNDTDIVNIHELKELLQSTDYKQVMHPNGLVLSDEQITNLLDRSDLMDEEMSK